MTKLITITLLISLLIYSCSDNSKTSKDSYTNQSDKLQTLNYEIESVINSGVHNVKVSSQILTDTLIVRIDNLKENNFCGLMVQYFAYENVIFKKSNLFEDYQLIHFQLFCDSLPSNMLPIVSDFDQIEIKKIVSRYKNNPNYLKISNYMLEKIISPDYSEIYFAYNAVKENVDGYATDKIEDVIYGASMDKEIDIKKSGFKKDLFFATLYSRELQFEYGFEHLKIIMDMCEIDTSVFSKKVDW